jgi:hypothetical protein
VWRVAIAIVRGNPVPFMQVVEQLHEREKLQGARLAKILARVRRISS